MTQKKGTAGIVGAIRNGTARTAIFTLKFIADQFGDDVVTLSMIALFFASALLS